MKKCNITHHIRYDTSGGVMHKVNDLVAAIRCVQEYHRLLDFAIDTKLLHSFEIDAATAAGTALHHTHHDK